MLRASLLALPLLLSKAAAGNCSFQPNTDFDEGSGGPSVPAVSPAECCALCANAGPAACWVAVFDEATSFCWFKTVAQSAFPAWNPFVTACWPPGSVPPPPPPPPPYNVTVLTRPDTPVISFLANDTDWPQSFNPAFVEPSAGTSWTRGLLVRSQNCSGWTPGQCIGCNVDAQHPIAPWFPGSVIAFAQQVADGSFARPFLVFAPDAGAASGLGRTMNSHHYQLCALLLVLQPEDYGTEDPRLTFDPSTSLYHSERRRGRLDITTPHSLLALLRVVFYTCFSSSIGPRLCHATTPDPTAPYPGNWTRLGQVRRGNVSRSLLYRGRRPARRWIFDATGLPVAGCWHEERCARPPPLSPALPILGCRDDCSGGDVRPRVFYNDQPAVYSGA